MGFSTSHKKRVLLNKNKFTEVINKAGYTKYIDFYRELIDEYGLDIEPKSVMNIVDNRVDWRLIYAYCITDKLNVDIKDIFDIIDVN